MDAIAEEVHGRRHVTELSLGTFFRIVRKLAGSDWKPSHICFEHTAPRSDATHRRFFGCRVEFEHEFNGIVFRSADLDAPLAMSDAMLARSVRESISHQRA